MLDLSLILLSSPCIGAFIGVSLAILENRKPERVLDTSFNHWEFIGPSKEEMALWQEIKREGRADLIYLAARALENCPDVSCDSVAEAFGLPKLVVRRLSKGHRGKKVTYYAPIEIHNLAKEGIV